ncbi:hypothetical protein SAMN05216337_1002157 [Bradyrhizobium brasilense]|uniref:Uncharacterized protein n=1 Tax=Bradyrhizobium brasilense TaxID=1419277 RepID=A0A1G6KQG1_9BRAD|nr:hypothetical protein SAMN05216337_1002157 [Bradyrhizobium brasilense]
MTPTAPSNCDHGLCECSGTQSIQKCLGMFY